MLFYELNCATSIEALTPQIWLYLEIKKVINVKWGHKGMVLFWEEGCCCCCCCCCWVASVVSDSVQPYRQQPTRLPHPWDSPGKNPGVDCHFLLQCMKVKREGEVTQSSPTLSDPMDCSPPGSSIHGILQARVLEWGAIAFSPERASTLIRRGRDTRDVFISLGMHRGKVMWEHRKKVTLWKPGREHSSEIKSV